MSRRRTPPSGHELDLFGVDPVPSRARPGRILRPSEPSPVAAAAPAPPELDDETARAAIEALQAMGAEGGFSVDPYARAPRDREPARARVSVEHAIPGASPASAVAISTLTQTAKDLLEGAFSPLWVRGEVTDFKAHRNGHWYFSLRDQVAQIKCVVWSRDQKRMPAAPDDGMQVVALGQVTVYAARGDLQLSVKAMDAQGDGLWRKALELTRAKLDADGLLDPARRRAIPRLPRCVAVVTSPDGAALHDILSVIRRRCPTVRVVVVPAKVQGDGAPEELRAAIERVGRWGGADVVIVGRGGGGREDLWAFNDERLARAVAACPVPIISAVGHEVDVTICDLVADLRAATPSAAAEAAVPVLAQLRTDVAVLRSALADAGERQVTDARAHLGEVAAGLRTVATRVTERRRAAVEARAGKLHALSPLATLARGYAVARGANGASLGRTAAFAPGTRFDLVLHDGVVPATVDPSYAAPEAP